MGQLPHAPVMPGAASSFAVRGRGALCDLLAGPVDFQALTPGRHWQASTGRQAVEEIILAWWFGAGDEITELCSVTSGRVLDREHVAYRVRVRRSGRDYGPAGRDSRRRPRRCRARRRRHR
jgi:hypothetical protein